MDFLGKSISLVVLAMIAILPIYAGASGEPEEPEIPGVERGDPPATAFEIEGSDLVYDRHDDFLWTYDEPLLSIKDTSDREFRSEVISDNVLRVHNSAGSVLLIRIGSPEYKAMQEFILCVQRNTGLELSDLETCEPPFG